MYVVMSCFMVNGIDGDINSREKESSRVCVYRSRSEKRDNFVVIFIERCTCR